MNKYLKILGDGQIWNVKRILPETPRSTFEDLFSGRALGRMAQEADRNSSPHKRIFSSFKEKGKITGLSVTRALFSKRLEARRAASCLLDRLAQNGASGIAALYRGRAIKSSWSTEERNNWKNLNAVIIGGGVSEEKTGRLLVRLMKKHLSCLGLSDIIVWQAAFPGKEAGFMGAVINSITMICREAELKDVDIIGGIGLDLGRDEIGVGLLAVQVRSGKILRNKKEYWFFRSSVKTPHRDLLKHFVDSRTDYSRHERLMGERLRIEILQHMVGLIVQAYKQARKRGLFCSHSIGVAVPGSVSYDGSIINSTDYLPFLRKQDGFHFSRRLEEVLTSRGLKGYTVHLVNDGIAAGIANVYFNVSRDKPGKVAFLGVGSGLGGCVGRVSAK